MSIIAKKLGLRPPNLKGRKLTEEHKNLISLAKKGKPGMAPSEESKRKNAEAHRGKIPSPETRIKLSNSHKGILAYNYIQWSTWQIIDIKNDKRPSRKICKDYNVSASTIDKVRIGFYDQESDKILSKDTQKDPWNKGKIGIFKHTDNTKEKIRQSSIGRGIGRIVSEETKNKISVAKKGKSWSEVRRNAQLKRNK